MQVKINAAFNGFVRLLDSGGSPVTGVAYTAVAAKLALADGSSTTVTPASAGDWTEITAGAFSGLGVYLLKIATNKASVLGQMVLALTASGAAASVVSFHEVVTNLESDTVSLIGTPAGASVSVDVAAVKTDTGNLRTDYTTARAVKIDHLDADVSSRSTFAGGAVASVSGAVGSVTGAVGSVTGNVGGNVTGSVGSVAGDVSGKVLGGGSSSITGTGVRAVDGSGAAIAPASTAVSNADYTSGRAAKLDDLDATVSSRLASGSYTAPDNSSITAIKAKTDNLPAAPASTGDVTTAEAAILASLPAAPDNTTIASTKTELDALRADYTTARAGKIDSLDAAVSSRAAASTALTNATWTDARAAKLDNADASVAAVKAKTDNLPAAPASTGDVAAATTAAGSAATAATAASSAASAAQTAAVASAASASTAATAATAAASGVSSLAGSLVGTIALSRDNTAEDQFTYDGSGNLTGSRLRHYDSAAHALAAGSTGLLETFSFTATYNGQKQITGFKVVRS